MIASAAEKCPRCGKGMQFDTIQEKYVCTSCGSRTDRNQAAGGQAGGAYMDMAMAAYRAGKYAEANAYFTSAAENDPDNWRALYYKGLAASWQSSIAFPRVMETIHGIQNALPIVESSQELSAEEKSGIRDDFASGLSGVTYAYFRLTTNAYHDYGSIYADNTNIIFATRNAVLTCIAYEEFALSLLGQISGAPNKTQSEIIKHIVTYCKWVCDYFQYWLDYNEKTLLYCGYTAHEKQPWISRYDELATAIRQTDPSFETDAASPIDRLDPPANSSEALKRKDVLRQMEHQRETENIRQAHEKTDTKIEAAKQIDRDKRPEDQLFSLNEDLRIQAQLQAERIKWAEEKEKLKKELEVQKAVADKYKFKMFGESAALRKQAEERIASLENQLAQYDDLK